MPSLYVKTEDTRMNKIVSSQIAKVRPLYNPSWSPTTSSTILNRVSAASAPSKGVRRMLSLQQSLPRLPVPPLQQTLDRFLTAVTPLCASEDDYKHAQQLVADFGKKGGVGEQLQGLLEKRAQEKLNWLEDWWLNVAYLEYRLPCPIHVNPGIMVPPLSFSGQQDQLQNAAKLVAGVMDYKHMIDDQSLPVEYMGKDPLCMDQFFKILSSCRVPGTKRDSLVNFPPTEPNPPKHITVVHNNHYFSVEVYSQENGEPLTEQQIYDQLVAIVAQSGKPAPPVGLLTAHNRNSWGLAFNKLTKDPQNRASLRSIQRSIFTLCLDQPIPHAPEACRESLIANQMNHGGGTSYNSANRWFDKTLQFIVGADGAVGANYEHCTAEGPPIISVVDHAMAYIKSDHPVRPPVSGVRAPLPLPFNVTADVQQYIDEARDGFDTCIQDLDMISYKFMNFGKEFPKSQKLSPDAFIQVAFQLAYYRMYGRCAPTYESGSLRRFQHGRTETIRSCTPASHAYCRAILDPAASVADRAQRLREAVTAHRQYTNYAINGQGVDRHLLGLKLSAIEAGMDVPAFFMDPIYQEAMHFRLSTSQVASKHDALLCFGPVVPDGYGVCYNPMPNHMNFAVSAWKSCPDTDAAAFAESLQKSFEDAQSILLQTAGSKL